MDDKLSQKLLLELREQVNTLLSAGQLLTALVREKGSSRDKECLAVTTQTLYRLMRTIQHMEAVQPENVSFHPQIVDLSQLCRRLGQGLALFSTDLGISVSWQMERENLLVLADPLILERAMLNLLTNAIQAAGQGGKVWLKMELKEGDILLSVEDNGPGFASLTPLDDDPFLKSPGGLGLGVKLAQQAAQLHGGALVWHERPEGGLRAVLSLPLRVPPEDSLFKSPVSDLTGGFSTLLVELSPLLPPGQFLPENVE